MTAESWLKLSHHMLICFALLLMRTGRPVLRVVQVQGNFFPPQQILAHRLPPPLFPERPGGTAAWASAASSFAGSFSRRIGEILDFRNLADGVAGAWPAEPQLTNPTNQFTTIHKIHRLHFRCEQMKLQSPTDHISALSGCFTPRQILPVCSLGWADPPPHLPIPPLPPHPHHLRGRGGVAALSFAGKLLQ